MYVKVNSPQKVNNSEIDLQLSSVACLLINSTDGKHYES